MLNPDPYHALFLLTVGMKLPFLLGLGGVMVRKKILFAQNLIFQAHLAIPAKNPFCKTFLLTDLSQSGRNKGNI